MTGYSKEKIVNAINIIKKTQSNSKISDYEIPNVSEKIVKLILSYFGKINKKIYLK